MWIKLNGYHASDLVLLCACFTAAVGFENDGTGTEIQFPQGLNIGVSQTLKVQHV